MAQHSEPYDVQAVLDSIGEANPAFGKHFLLALRGTPAQGKLDELGKPLAVEEVLDALNLLRGANVPLFTYFLVKLSRLRDRQTIRRYKQGTLVPPNYLAGRVVPFERLWTALNPGIVAAKRAAALARKHGCNSEFVSLIEQFDPDRGDIKDICLDQLSQFLGPSAAEVVDEVAALTKAPTKGNFNSLIGEAVEFLRFIEENLPPRDYHVLTQWFISVSDWLKDVTAFELESLVDGNSGLESPPEIEIQQTDL
jgi:hypothetical protein